MLLKIMRWCIALLLGLPALLVAVALLWFAIRPLDIIDLRKLSEIELTERLGQPVSITTMQLVPSSALLDLRLQGVTLFDQQRSRPLVQIGETRIRVKTWNLSTLLQGRIPLEIVILNGNAVAINKGTDREWFIAGQAVSVWQAKFQQPLPRPAVHQVDTGSWQQQLAGYAAQLLEHLQITTVRLGKLSLDVLQMPSAGSTIQAVGKLNLIDAQLHNRSGETPIQWAMHGDFTPNWGVEQGDAPVTYTLEGALQQRGRWHLAGKVAHLRPDRWTNLLGKAGASLAGLQFPMQGEFRLHGGDGEPWKSRWKVVLGSGVWDTHGLFRWPIPISNLSAEGQAQQELEASQGWRLQVNHFDLYNNQGHAQGKLLLTGMGLTHSPYVDLAATFGGIDTQEAKFFYPPHYMNPYLLKWLDNALLKGSIPHAEVTIKGPAYAIPFLPKGAHKAKGTFLVKAQVRDLDLAYFPQLPPIKGADVTLTFANEKMIANVHKGSLGKSKNLQGTATIPEILGGDQTLLVDAKIDGDMHSIWHDVIQNPRLKWGDHVGLNGAAFEGQGDFKLKMTLPLNHSIDVSYDTLLNFNRAKATLPFLPQPIEHAAGLLHINDDVLDLKITQANYDALPFTGTIKALDYAKAGESDLRVLLHAPLTASQLQQRLVGLLEEVPHFQGASALAVDLHRSKGAPSYTANLQWDLSKLLLNNYKGVEKTKYSKGLLALQGSFDPKQVAVDVQQLQLEFGNLRSQGHGFWLHGQEETQIILEPFQLGQSKGRLHFRQGGLDQQAPAYRLEGTFSQLDLTHWQQPSLPESISATEPPILKRVVWNPEKLSKIPQRPTILVLKAEQVQMANQIQAEALDLQARLDAKNLWIGPCQFKIDDKIVKVNGQLTWENRVGQGAYQGQLDFESDDLGRVLKGANLHDGLNGGKGKISLTLAGEAIPNQTIITSLSGEGTVKIEQGTIKQLDLLSKLLGLLSVQELPMLLFGKRPDLQEEGFYFRTLEGGFTLKQGQWHSDKVEISGPSMKMVISGDLDLPAQKMDLLVGVRPLQSLDAIISSVPLLGQILAGGREALLETQFSVEGAMDGPKIFLKPISTLAPGIVRDILQASGKLLTEQSDNNKEPEDAPTTTRPPANAPLKKNIDTGQNSVTKP
ncbi:membrane protein-like protein [Magnetococcus marinus MC-1]|uniref:Membrane protein-like protein n=1 Tax=Magnetococcus marinus (strain ATCC BAA-1437 / JCM 17883 / MC-1) TaxID=156889 RepID=A0L8S6_MAGMM|nr:AsmA-like C-terminal domain-containing protein [Magnetococcus marinus]ABK44369.1 membrane protein-like protein [Magnetococcus marinus MC-1]